MLPRIDRRGERLEAMHGSLVRTEALAFGDAVRLVAPGIPPGGTGLAAGFGLAGGISDHEVSGFGLLADLPAAVLLILCSTIVL